MKNQPDTHAVGRAIEPENRTGQTDENGSRNGAGNGSYMLLFRGKDWDEQVAPEDLEILLAG